MNIIESTLEILKAEESFSAKPYNDNKGIAVGYGRNLTMCPLTEEEAEYLLLYQVGLRLDGIVDRLKFWSKLPEEARVVLLCMAYQMGVNGVINFRRTLMYMEEGMWREAADEMLDSNWARQTPARAERMAAYIRDLAES